MLFNTVGFAAFFLVVTATYFALPCRFRRIFLLAASYYFYMCWSVRYITVILGITLIDYLAGIGIEQAQGIRRRILLTLSITSNFGLLFVFKYADFFSRFLGPAFGADLPQLHWLLPVGISFHTFQAVSYTVDVYRGRVKAERTLEVYALYVAFFPQMVAGPIERPGHLLPQFQRFETFDWTRVRSGLRLALWGLIKKAAVADVAATAVNTVYGRPRDFPGPMLLVATLLFSVQIYCDFSGYSDMAVGLARVLGYELMLNFRQPYESRSVREFWQRWHISLSTWFRDYLYIPLGGNRLAGWRWGIAIMIVFLTSGLWHGANWTFVAWGALHGLYLIVSALTRSLRARLGFAAGFLHNFRQIAITNFLVTLAWVFFRAASLRDAFYILGNMWNFRGFDIENLFQAGLPRFEMTFLPIAAAAMFTVEHLRRTPGGWFASRWNRRVWRWPAYAAAVYAVVFFGVFEHVEFIYFQF